MVNTILKQRRSLPAIGILGLTMTLALAGVSMADTPTSAPESMDPPPLTTNEQPVVSLTDAELVKVQEDGGYDVQVSTVSDALLVAEDGAVPVPYDQRVWGPEEQDRKLGDLSADLMGIVGMYPENLAEVAFSSDDSFLEVYAKDTEGMGIADIAMLVENRGMVGKVVIVGVAHSRSEMEEAQRAINFGLSEDLNLSTDYIANEISATPGTPEAEAEILPITDEGIIPIAELVDNVTGPASNVIVESDLADVSVLVKPYVESESAGRDNDYSPYIMGGKILNSKGQGCSLGIPIVHAKTFMVLTAAHCGYGGFTNGNGQHAVGGTWVNTISVGSVGKYGDWQFLSGQHYLLSLWRTPAHSNTFSTLPIASAQWGSMARGRGLCTSGQTTGQVCRYRVDQPVTTSYVDGRYTGMLTSMSHENVQGTWDTNGFDHGDSGGPVYYTDSNEAKVVVGIVTSVSPDRFSYYFTRLEGVKAAYPSVYVG